MTFVPQFEFANLNAQTQVDILNGTVEHSPGGQRRSAVRRHARHDHG